MADDIWANSPADGFAFARALVDGDPQVLVVAQGRAWTLRTVLSNRHAAGTIAGLLPDWDSVCDDVEQWLATGGPDTAPGAVPDPGDVLTPVERPQIFQAAANYRRHVIELMVASPRPEHVCSSESQRRQFATELMDQRAASGTPTVFAGLPSSLTPPFGTVVIPEITDECDWELELAVVLKSDAYLVPRERAWEHIAGYTIVNDVTMRDRIYPTGDSSRGADWIACKSAPTFLPVGPLVVPARYVPDPMALTITLRLNHEVMQNEAASDMIFDIPRLLEHASACARLQAGDLLLTGSPAGNGVHHGRFLECGDVMTGSITGLGIQRTPVTSTRESAHP